MTDPDAIKRGAWMTIDEFREAMGRSVAEADRAYTDHAQLMAYVSGLKAMLEPLHKEQERKRKYEEMIERALDGLDP